MLKKTAAIPFILLFLITFFLSGSIAQSASIKERMASRIPAINALKAKGAIGENNKGFLEFRGNNQPQKDVIGAENKDRLQVYKAIGKKQGASSTLVGQRRAKTIAQKSKPGHWYQKPDGKWAKK
jgi:uncharacterized protein YdbL (DUF1318 family)